MTRRLSITAPATAQQTFVLAAGIVRIGRHPDSHIRLPGKAVSTRHARITVDEQHCTLHDCASTNGTRVNGQPVQQHALRSGDVIEIAAFRLEYHAGDEDEDAFAKTQMLSAAELERALQAEIRQRRSSSSNPGGARLRHTGGARAGQTLLLDKTLTTLGKPSGALAAVTRRTDGFYIVHVGALSTHRARVNGQAIDARARKLLPGDQIEVADLHLIFEAE
ncbi:FHA domain-containing protein [Sinimarinibacterium sp. NLF-5-8]|uniref:FHA domain-containing protein n=1 Tax=Sinimarinibacterium sp. NLF-5-8 TaxID=2698684 RepID=UPI00137C3925|nr:FHA domain-containing protein [Sinimarinibacterium sp. NLF-5-8]QHS09920.1 FHA domain-containing protein [Sinimarinibacterium sp. NLF-5-8]